MSSMKIAAAQALACQDACNLSGVLSSFNDIVREVIWPEANRLGKGSRFVNEHPVVVAFLDKLSSLARCQHLSAPRTSAAFDACEKLAQGIEIVWPPADGADRVEVVEHIVVVGNIGRVYAGPNPQAALDAYNAYCEIAKQPNGRAAGESVTLFRDGEITASLDSTSEVA